jgi:hypothetical protein
MSAVTATKIMLQADLNFAHICNNKRNVTAPTCFLLQIGVKPLAQHTNPRRLFVTPTPTTKRLQSSSWVVCNTLHSLGGLLLQICAKQCVSLCALSTAWLIHLVPESLFFGIRPVVKLSGLLPLLLFILAVNPEIPEMPSDDKDYDSGQQRTN